MTFICFSSSSSLTCEATRLSTRVSQLKHWNVETVTLCFCFHVLMETLYLWGLVPVSPHWGRNRWIPGTAAVPLSNTLTESVNKLITNHQLIWSLTPLLCHLDGPKAITWWLISSADHLITWSADRLGGQSSLHWLVFKSCCKTQTSWEVPSVWRFLFWCDPAGCCSWSEVEGQRSFKCWLKELLTKTPPPPSNNRPSKYRVLFCSSILHNKDVIVIE